MVRSPPLPILIQSVAFRRLLAPVQLPGPFPISDRPYIAAMPRRKREHTWHTWEVRRLRSSPAILLGLVDAENEAEALARAIEQFDVRPEDQNRVLVMRYQ